MSIAAAEGSPPVSDKILSWRMLAAALFVFLYYWALLSDGKFLAAEPVHYGLVFNSMIEYMSQGRFDVDPNAVLKEGFERDGHTYAYFGVVPALLRLPLLVLPQYKTVDFTIISCAIAATLAVIAKLAAILRAGRIMGAVPYRNRILAIAMAAIVFGGPQVQFMRPSIFQEALFWASAEAALFVFMAFRWCVEPLDRKPSHLTAMAVLAGLCLITRVSTSVGLYAACGGIMMVELIAAVTQGSGAFLSRLVRVTFEKLLLPSLILIVFIIICGYINYERWGSPLTFQDYRYYNSVAPDDPVFEVIKNYGYFNVRRIPFGFVYFFFPIWAISGPDGHFIFRAFQDRLLYIAELPPATFLLSDPFLCFSAVLGIIWLARARAARVDRFAACLTGVSLILPGLLMMMAIAITFRYRMEFYPGFEFLALFGLLNVARKFALRPRRMNWACWLMVAVSCIAAHGFLLAYKIGPWGEYPNLEAIGLRAAYQDFFRDSYPGLYNKLGQR